MVLCFFIEHLLSFFPNSFNIDSNFIFGSFFHRKSRSSSSSFFLFARIMKCGREHCPSLLEKISYIAEKIPYSKLKNRGEGGLNNLKNFLKIKLNLNYPTQFFFGGKKFFLFFFLRVVSCGVLVVVFLLSLIFLFYDLSFFCLFFFSWIHEQKKKSLFFLFFNTSKKPLFAPSNARKSFIIHLHYTKEKQARKPVSYRLASFFFFLFP